jgi:hypothetical protein
MSEVYDGVWHRLARFGAAAGGDVEAAEKPIPQMGLGVAYLGIVVRDFESAES